MMVFTKSFGLETSTSFTKFATGTDAGIPTVPSFVTVPANTKLPGKPVALTKT